ncbi:MAG: hypothetical protein KGL12_06800 [Rhodospirillales bacterium]|nr:hypothetical protein [Rhodospirillales bacterium]
MKIVFYGEDTATFADGFAALLSAPASLSVLPYALESAADRAAYAGAEVLVATRLADGVPAPAGLRLLQVPAAGYDRIDFAALPEAAEICNCFGHEQAIAEYVIAALLDRCVRLGDADARLRRGDWAYQAGDPARAHREISEMTIGLLGFGHIGRKLGELAHAFGMNIVIANRSPIAAGAWHGASFGLRDRDFWAAADAIVVSLPLTEDTKGLVGAVELGAMRPDAVIINVGRGPVIEEDALYAALAERRIGGAVIDTWYRYPSAEDPTPLPGTRPFHGLANIVMTPHMSGWSTGTIRRRRAFIAANVERLRAGMALENIVRA